MAEKKEGERPKELKTHYTTKDQDNSWNQQEITVGSQLAPIIGERLGWAGRTHEQLVKGFKDYIRQEQKKLRAKGEEDHASTHTSVKIMANALVHYRAFSYGEAHKFVKPLVVAWDVLSYDYYKPDSFAQAQAGLNVAVYHR